MSLSLQCRPKSIPRTMLILNITLPRLYIQFCFKVCNSPTNTLLNRLFEIKTKSRRQMIAVPTVSFLEAFTPYVVTTRWYTDAIRPARPIGLYTNHCAAVEHACAHQSVMKVDAMNSTEWLNDCSDCNGSGYMFV